MANSADPDQLAWYFNKQWHKILNLDKKKSWTVFEILEKFTFSAY